MDVMLPQKQRNDLLTLIPLIVLLYRSSVHAALC